MLAVFVSKLLSRLRTRYVKRYRQIRLLCRFFGALTDGVTVTWLQLDQVGHRRGLHLGWTEANPPSPLRTPKNSDGLHVDLTRLQLSPVDFWSLILVDSIPQICLTPSGLESTRLSSEAGPPRIKSPTGPHRTFIKFYRGFNSSGLRSRLQYGLRRSWVHVKSTKFKSPPRSPLEFYSAG